jgi:hypothetical protein
MALASPPALLLPPLPAPGAVPGQAPGQVVGGSFRDPGGFVFWRDGELFRQINACCATDYELLLASGLYDELVEAGLLVPHEEVEEPACDEAAAYKVVRPRRLAFVSYPYEWCFSHLKDAALATLRIQRRALARGMWLKDASAYNIQLDARHGGRQVLIDTLSLERYSEGRPWVAYRQFCQHFLAPLALMARCDARLGQLLRVHLDGVPLDLASGLLPWRTRLSPGLLMHVHLHARRCKRSPASWRSPASDRSTCHPERREGAGEPPREVLRCAQDDKCAGPLPGSREPAAREPRVPRKQFSRRSLNLLIDSLERLVQGLEFRRGNSAWGDYYASLHNYTPEALAAKEQIVGEFLDRSRPTTVWDLGANDGRFSRLATRRGALTVCWDIDPVCVERNYRGMQTEAGSRAEWPSLLVPLLLDLTNPSPALGWAHQERMSLAQRGPADLVMALGLVHHLAIGNNLPWDRIAAFLARLGRELIVEFVPKDDSQVERMLANRCDVFADYHQAGFEAAFGRHFEVVCRRPIPGSLRGLYAMRRKRLALG